MNNKMKNILWIMTDQQKYNAFSGIFCIKNLTPNLDVLAADALRFENAYTPCPICGPARASLKTGCYPPVTGVIKNWVSFKEGLAFLPMMLKEAGWTTGLVGKLHFYPPNVDYGFEKKYLSDSPYSTYSLEDVENSAYINSYLRPLFKKEGKVDPVILFNKDEESYDDDLKRFMLGSNFRTKAEHETEWTKNLTIKMLEERDKDRPFFLYSSFFGPHQPYCPPSPYDTMYSPDDIILPDSWRDDFKEDSPVFNHECRNVYDHIKKNISDKDAQIAIAKYLGQVKMIDDAIGEILNYLKQNGLYDKTVIIFTSDHGDHLSEHGLFFKGQMYDSCLKVPLIIRDPSGDKGVVEHVVNTIDLYQTILDYSGLDNRNAESESISLLPLIKDRNSVWVDDSFSIIGATPERVLSSLRRNDLKLIRFLDNGNVYYEMYDLSVDAEENHDIWPSMKDESPASKMKEDLDSWSEREISKY